MRCAEVLRKMNIMKSQVQYVLPLLFSLLTCGAAILLTPSVSGTRQSDSLDRPCPGETLVYTCSEANTFLIWTVAGVVLHTYVASNSATFITKMDPNTRATARAMAVEPGTPITSTLTINAMGNGGVLIECTDRDIAETVNITLNLAAPPMPPEYDCTLPSQRTLRLEWIDNNMNADDSVDEYRACNCIGGECPCVPTACGDLSNNCVREFAADQVHNFMFTAVNCGSQESNASALTVDARAEPPPIKVSAWYNQSTGDLSNIAVTWDTVAPISVPVGCVEGIAQQYNVRCGNNFDGRGFLQSIICNGGMCQFNSPASTGCTLSVDSVNVMGTRTTTQDVPGTTPLIVTVSDGRNIACSMICNISYGIDPSFETLPNAITSGTAGVELTQLVIGEKNFYVVSADIGSLTVKVKGSLRTECECSELVSGSGTCLDSGTLSIRNGMVTYGSVSIGSKATYQCVDGFSLSGVSTRTCLVDGSWSDSLPTCQESNFAVQIIGGIVGGIAVILLVLVVVMIVYLKKKVAKYSTEDRRELRERTRSDDGQPDVEIAEVGETAPTYADPSAIDRQEFPGTHDVYTVVDKTKKTHKPEDHLPTYQTPGPDDIKRQPAPATGEVYTIPEPKKGSKKKKEATPPQKSDENLQQMYSQVDMGKKHQPPSGLIYSDLNLPPSGKAPPSKSVYAELRPH